MSRRASEILRTTPFLLGVLVGALLVGCALGGLLVTGALNGSALNVALGPRVSAWVISENDPLQFHGASAPVTPAHTLYFETSTARIFYAGSNANPVGFATASLTSPRARGLDRAAQRLQLFRGPPASLTMPHNQEAVVSMKSPHVDATIRMRAAWSGFLTTARVRSGPWEQKLVDVVGRWVLVSRGGTVRKGKPGVPARIRLSPGEPYAIFVGASAPIVIAVNQAASLLIDRAPGRGVITARLSLASPRQPVRTFVGVAAANVRPPAATANGAIDTTPKTRGSLGALFDQATYVSSSL